MGQYKYSISREVQIDFECVSTGLDGALDGCEGVFGEFALVASMGDGLWEAGEGMCWREISLTARTWDERCTDLMLKLEFW
jgi:hypothetical protein